jgi:hypothetical protein
MFIGDDNCISAQRPARFDCVCPQLPGRYQSLPAGVLRGGQLRAFRVLDQVRIILDVEIIPGHGRTLRITNAHQGCWFV